MIGRLIPSEVVEGEYDEIAEGKLFTCKNRSLTNYIIKPEVNPQFPDIVDNEYFCMKLAEKAGIRVPKVYKRVLYGDMGPVPALMIERFDRYNNDGVLTPIHVEDLCQATGQFSVNKYQDYNAERGQHIGSGFLELFNIIRSGDKTALGMRQVIKLLIFNYLIENQDSHGKNFSFLYKKADLYEFAPAYDHVSTGVYKDTNEELSMHIGGEYDPYKITAEKFQAFCKEINLGYKGFGKEVRQVLKSLEGTISKTQASYGKMKVERKIAEIAARRGQHLSDIFDLGFDFSWDEDQLTTAFVNPDIQPEAT